ncbi:MAG TPA: lipid A deacylase LpxR family protein [Puia sp.]|nr:lipid A deacylase LpxR family protein [Puia sp.]
MNQLLHGSILLILLQVLAVYEGDAQKPANETLTEQGPTRLFRAYWDDDYFNYGGKGTDRAYTDGTRFELFYTKKRPSRFFIDRMMPTAGDSSTNVFGWGLVQLMVTPNDISRKDFQPDDYPWSGALFATHTLYSYNEQKKYDFQTEIDLGVTGPAALAGQTQDMVHRLIHYRRPEGWKNQFGNSPLLDFSFTAEKQLAGYRQFLEIIGGGQAFIGTGMNGAGIYSLVRIGKMTPYFKGFMKQYSSAESKKRIQFYFIFKPQVQWLLSNSLLQGGLNCSEKVIVKEPSNEKETYHQLNHLVSSFTFGPVLVMGHFTISSTQTATSAWMKGLYDNTYGNLSLYYSW